MIRIKILKTLNINKNKITIHFNKDGEKLPYKKL